MNISCKHAFVGLLSLSLLAGCGDPKAANAGNFTKALQRYYDAHPICVSLPVNLPLDVSADTDSMTRRQLDALVARGLLSTTKARSPDLPADESGRPGAAYSLTSAGEKTIRKGADTFMGGTDICFAHRGITKVESFSEPVAQMGMKVSRVTYDYELTEVEPWASDDGIQSAFPRIKATLATPIGSSTEEVVLTQDGWQHERALQ
jgi:hypothetical protein